MPRPRCCDGSARPTGRPVDVDDPASLAAALAGTDSSSTPPTCATTCRSPTRRSRPASTSWTSASYYPETLEQLDRHDAAVAAGCRIVPGCGVAPGLTNILARLGADRLDRVDAIRMYSYITHPMWTSPGIVVTRFDASTGTSRRPRGRRARRARLVLRRGALRLPGAVRRAGGPPRPAPRAGDPAALHRRARTSVQGRLPGRRDAAHPRPARARLRSRDAVRGRRRADLASTVRGGVHRQARDRPGERSANVKHVRRRGRTGRAAHGDARPTTSPSRRSAGRRHRRSPAPSRRSPPTWSRAAGRPASTRPRPPSTRGRSSRRWPNAG